MRREEKSKHYRFFEKEAVNLVFLALGILLFYQVSDYLPMARTFPKLVLTMIFGLVLLDLIKAVISIIGKKTRDQVKEPAGAREDSLENLAAGKRVFVTVLLMFVSLGLMQLLGFTFGCFVFLFLSAWVLGFKNLKHLLLASSAITCFVYIIFILIMKSILPQSYIWAIFLRG